MNSTPAAHFKFAASKAQSDGSSLAGAVSDSGAIVVPGPTDLQADATLTLDTLLGRSPALTGVLSNATVKVGAVSATADQRLGYSGPLPERLAGTWT